MEREWVPRRPVDLRSTLGPLAHARTDRTCRFAEGSSLWRTMRTPEGSATQWIAVDASAGVVSSRSWGPGADWAADRLPRLLGADDDVTGFDPRSHPLVAAQWSRYGAGWRMPATGLVLESLVPAVLEQKVTGEEARRGWGWLLSRYGEPAPGPAPEGMRVLPEPAVLARIPSWEWHRAGVGPHRAATLVRVSRVAGRLEQCADLPRVEAHRRLTAVAGVGTWTAAEVAVRALGDPDAVSFGDYHLARQVVLALAGEDHGTDEQMADLLAPWAGHRARVVRMVELSGIAPERHGPRLAPRDYRRM